MAAGDVKILVEKSGPEFEESTLDAERGRIAGFNAQTGTNYTLALSDLGKIVTLSNSSAVEVTIPPDSSVAFDDKSVVVVQRIGEGTVEIKAGSGVTLNGKYYIATQWNIIVCIKTDEDEWTLIGGVDP